MRGAKNLPTHIEIKDARVNNLKGIDVNIPLEKFTIVTGLSGSGKSSLVFDTLYAEGQRRYVESLSAYIRQFLGRINKPDVEHIHNIPPAIAIEQKVNTRNPRSTVGTSTEVYEYLKLLYAKIGKTISPISGEEVKKHSVKDIQDVLATLSEGSKIALLSPLKKHDDRTVEEQLEIFLKEGYSRIMYQDRFLSIESFLSDDENVKIEDLLLAIDRLTVQKSDAFLSRVADSAETAFYEGDGECYLFIFEDQGMKKFHFSNRFEKDGIIFEEPSEQLFSFNNPAGACPMCEGFGKVMGINADLVIPDKDLSLYEGAIAPWRGERLKEWLQDFIVKTNHLNFPIHRPYKDLSSEDLTLLWDGDKEQDIWGINEFFHMLESNLYKIQNRVMLARYRGKTICPVCHGSRLKPQAAYVKIGGKSISELVKISLEDLAAFFENHEFAENEIKISERILHELKSRIQVLNKVGLSYLTLDRLSNTLSGGESQRINLATAIGSSLVGSLYVLDEPSIGLHPRDTECLIEVLIELKELGNTLVVVEHDEEIIRASDHIIDIGPKAGRLGGEVVFQGSVDNLPEDSQSYTVRYLTGKCSIPVPKKRRIPNKSIRISGAKKHNLKNVDVDFPLQVMTVVTGVSGSGKSTLVTDLLYNGLKGYLENPNKPFTDFASLSGDLAAIKAIELVDQYPIGRSTRSNCATYMKAYDEIRKLFASCPLSKQMDYTPASFSFNVDGGRCEECKGEGVITIEMQFMADIVLECEVCHGKRFHSDILEVKYKGKNIFDVLEMTVNEAIEFFSESDGSIEKKIVKRLIPLQNVGLGYIKLGQSSSTLSGGENQRVKLAHHLGEEKNAPTLFIFDEPTTGLHFHDINTLLTSFNALIQRGHSVLIIEHNMDVIKCADYIIDMGPDGGDKGGFVVCFGTPEDVAKCKESYTGQFLKDKLKT